MDEETLKYLIPTIQTLFEDELSKDGVNAVLHCAAGIHRAGTIGYTILGLSGYSAEESRSLLQTIREETHKGVGDWRIELSEKELVPRIQSMIQLKGPASILPATPKLT